MVQFKLTCPRHRLEYIDIMQRNGVRDPMEMERLRLRFVSLVSKTYPAGYFDHIKDQVVWVVPSRSPVPPVVSGPSMHWRR